MPILGCWTLIVTGPVFGEQVNWAGVRLRGGPGPLLRGLSLYFGNLSFGREIFE
jgi:hypothetical protein